MAATGDLEEKYLALLDVAFADQHISGDEVRDLTLRANAAGFTEADLRRLHTEFVSTRCEMAKSDGVLTEQKYRDLWRLAHLLEVPNLLRNLTPTEPRAQPVSRTREPGTVVATLPAVTGLTAAGWIWTGRGLMGLGLFLMSMAVMALFGGAPAVVGFGLGGIGVSLLLFGWKITDPELDW